MKKITAKKILYIFIQYLRGQNIVKYLQHVKENQRKSLPEIIKLRDQKLNNIVSSAYRNVPYYTKKFKQLNIRPEDINCVADLQRLPVMSKREVLENEKELIAPNFNEKL